MVAIKFNRWFLEASAEVLRRNMAGPLKTLNFGQVVNNNNYQIYRSARLGESGLAKLTGYLTNNSLPLPKTIIYLNSVGYHLGYVAQEWYGQNQFGFTFYHSFDASEQTYIDGHNPYFPRLDVSQLQPGSEASELFLLASNQRPDGGIHSFLRVLSIILDPANQPVLYHCFGGMHRTGMVSMALRLIQGGWWQHGPQQNLGTIDLNPLEQEYLRYCGPLLRKDNIEFIRYFAQDPRFLELRKKYQDQLRDGSECPIVTETLGSKVGK